MCSPAKLTAHLAEEVGVGEVGHVVCDLEDALRCHAARMHHALRDALPDDKDLWVSRRRVKCTDTGDTSQQTTLGWILTFCANQITCCTTPSL